MLLPNDQTYVSLKTDLKIFCKSGSNPAAIQGPVCSIVSLFLGVHVMDVVCRARRRASSSSLPTQTASGSCVECSRWPLRWASSTLSEQQLPQPQPAPPPSRRLRRTLLVAPRLLQPSPTPRSVYHQRVASSTLRPSVSKLRWLHWTVIERRSLTSFPCPALGLQLTGDHVVNRQPTNSISLSSFRGK